MALTVLLGDLVAGYAADAGAEQSAAGALVAQGTTQEAAADGADDGAGGGCAPA